MVPLDTLEENLNQTLKAPKLDPVLLAVANDYLANQEISEIATSYGITPDRVTQILEKKEVKEYINTIFLTQGYLHRNKRLALINKVIDHKLEEATESGIYSKVDLLYWIKMLNEIETSIRPKKEVPQVAIQVNNNYQELMKKLIEE